ncbi:unnamed protein product [Sphenostylis stenocarpa]|uniref:Uncharacterized protein n=1 Tax=Sphenostylis stenocarpa TaxID=92480 RepID=A0AA86S6U3_9FABA|nr:unnamed protein product [Sphenostylis stenocarpa]
MTATLDLVVRGVSNSGTVTRCGGSEIINVATRNRRGGWRRWRHVGKKRRYVCCRNLCLHLMLDGFIGPEMPSLNGLEPLPENDECKKNQRHQDLVLRHVREAENQGRFQWRHFIELTTQAKEYCARET